MLKHYNFRLQICKIQSFTLAYCTENYIIYFISITKGIDRLIKLRE